MQVQGKGRTGRTALGDSSVGQAPAVLARAVLLQTCSAGLPPSPLHKRSRNTTACSPAWLGKGLRQLWGPGRSADTTRLGATPQLAFYTHALLALVVIH